MSAPAAIERTALRETPLAGLHRALGARMVPFAGYAMPLHYGDGIIAEHRHTRAGAGLFDISHMGVARLVGPSYAAAAAALEAMTPGDFAGLAPGRMRYSLLLTGRGTIVDDIMVSRSADPAAPHLTLVLNAARTEIDLSFMRARLPAGVTLDLAGDRAVLALQGPLAGAVMARHADAAGLRFLDVASVAFDGRPCTLSRSGYTGEDGFELIVAAADAETVARTLLAEPEVKPAGLGARDTLRLEAGLPLYGHDIDEGTTPVEAGLSFAVAARRRRAADFPGADRILAELAEGPARRLIGLLLEGKQPARESATVLTGDGTAVGRVTSGGFGPTVERAIAIASVAANAARPGTPLLVAVRQQRLAAAIVPLPFVPHNYRRQGSPP